MEEVTPRYKNLAYMFWRRVNEASDKTSYVFKKDGEWKKMTWREAGDVVGEIASGLLEIGLKKDEKVNILAYTCLEWVLSDFAIMSAGGVSVPIYQTLTAEQAQYIIEDCEAKYIFVENLEQLEKIKSVRDKIPEVRKVVVFRELERGDGDWVMTLDELRDIGRMKPRLEDIKRIAEDIELDDIATIVYTSGTTGPPKGVVQTHKNHLSMSEMLVRSENFVEDDLVFLFLPLAHSFARSAEFATLYLGSAIAFAEGMERIAHNIREVRPTMLPSVPRVFEKVRDAIISQASESPTKKRIFDWAMKVGLQVSRLKQSKKSIPLLLKVRYALADRLVLRKIREALGGKIRIMVSGGAPISKDVLEFFHAVGLLILEGYGLTETCPAVTMNRVDNFKFGTVGLPFDGVDIKIAEDGEIVVKGPNIAKGYYKKEEETREAFLKDEWFRTGDIGEIDEDGFLKITDRKKDLIVTAGGKNIAPQIIENMVKAQDPVISQVVMIGDKKPYCVALITLTKEEVEKFAEEQGFKDLAYDEKVKHPKVEGRIRKAIEDVNSRLASFETIKKFRILPEDFTIESGDLTPTLKVKRNVVMKRYADIIEEMYTK